MIINFSPISATFRDKMARHKQLLCCTQMIWIQNLQAHDLESIGTSLFVEPSQAKLEEKALKLQKMDTSTEQWIEKEGTSYEIQKTLVLN